MKALIFILFLFPALCFAQEEKSKTNAPVKPSTTDCPTWNKKDKKTDKAAYFKSLRTNKTKVNQQTTSNPNNYRDPKIQPNSVQQKTESSDQKITVKQTQAKRNTEEVTVLQTKTEKRPAVVSSKENTSNIPAEDKKTTSEQKQITQEADKKDITPSSLEKKAEENAPEDQKTNAPKTEKAENDKTENSKIKKKLERMSRKTTKVRKHSNAKCPSF
ncbi:MAG: hypothetical protein K8R85_13040 [Bacteroidetes bacterium]|nr:hypothetical protein [Bacteroidota bacterium]